jgi:hypothetical protein
MAFATYAATIKLSGTPTTFTEEATTETTANTVFQVTDATKRIWDPATAVVVEVDPDGVSGFDPADPADYSLDYLFGKVTFSPALGASAVVRVSGKYLPMLSVAEPRGLSIDQVNTLHDVSTIGTAYRKKLAGLIDDTGSIDSLDTGSTDIDSGGGTVKTLELLRNSTPKLLEIVFGSLIYRAWVTLSGLPVKAPFDGVVESTVEWEASPQLTTEGTRVASGWSA